MENFLIETNEIVQEIISDDGDIKGIEFLVRSVLEKAKNLGKKLKIEFEDDLDELERRIMEIVHDQKENPEHSKQYYRLRKSYFEDRDSMFKKEYYLLMNGFVKNLIEKKKKYDWINVEEIVRPFLKIRIKPLEDK